MLIVATMSPPSQIVKLPVNSRIIHPNFPNECSRFTDEILMKNPENVRQLRLVLTKEGDPMESLLLVDAIQRLGVDHHFDGEIGGLLKRQYNKGIKPNFDHKYKNLHDLSLCFRLWRQEGLYATPDVFKNFMDNEGKFKGNLSEDIRGLMGLYEASQLSVEGEEILDEAQAFSSHALKASLMRLDEHQGTSVRSTLGHPFRKSMARYKSFLGGFRGKYLWEERLEQLALVDFYMVQSLFQREVLQVSKWWQNLGLSKELRFIRDQPLKWYAWAMDLLPDPGLSDQRIRITKSIAFIYIIDDIFDVYGTLDQLTLFVEAVNRWDDADVDKLPDYMKTCFKALYNITNEIGLKVYKEHGFNPIKNLAKTWGSMCEAFLQEAKWFGSGHVPGSKEYLKNGVVSSGVHVALIHIYFLLGNGGGKDDGDISGIISSVATILRLWDDLGSAKDENQDGHDGSYIECYLKEHHNLSVETAREHVTKKISKAWKRLNKECLSHHNYNAASSSSFTKASLNLAKMVPLMYCYDDTQSLPMLEDCKLMTKWPPCLELPPSKRPSYHHIS